MYALRKHLKDVDTVQLLNDKLWDLQDDPAFWTTSDEDDDSHNPGGGGDACAGKPNPVVDVVGDVDVDVQVDGGGGGDVKEQPGSGVKGDVKADGSGVADDAGGSGVAASGENADEDLLVNDDLTELLGVMGSYSCMRNMLSEGEFANSYQAPKPVLEYVNRQYVEENFRSTGMYKKFRLNNVEEASLEVEAMVKWCKKIKRHISGTDMIGNLCIPMFCHLYMNIYELNEHDEMIKYWEKFQHLFRNSGGYTLIKELKCLTDLNNLPPKLNTLRKNKVVLSCTPQLLTKFSKLLHDNFMLKVTFTEWFEVQFYTCDNPYEVFNSYCEKTVDKITNDLRLNDEENVSEKSNIPDINNEHFSNKKPNSSQNYDQNVNGPISNSIDDQLQSTSKKYKNCNNQESQPSKDRLKDAKEILLSSDCGNENPQRKHRLVKNPEVNKILDDPNCNNLEHHPSHNQLQNIEILQSDHSKNEKLQRKHRLVKNSEDIKSLDDQHIEPQPNKYQPKMMEDEIYVVSSDSENEMLQRKHQVIKKTKSIDVQVPTTSRNVQTNHHKEYRSNKNQPKVTTDEVSLVSSDSENEMPQSNHQLVKKPEVHKCLDDQPKLASRGYQNCNNQEHQPNKDQPNSVISLSSDSENELSQREHQQVKNPDFIYTDTNLENSLEGNKRKSRRTKKNYVKRKHSSQDRERSSSYEQESRKKKKQGSREECDSPDLQNGSSNQENVQRREQKSFNPGKYEMPKSNTHRMSFVFRRKDEHDNSESESEEKVKTYLRRKTNLEDEHVNSESESEENDEDHDATLQDTTFQIRSSFQDSSDDSSGDSYCSRYSFYDEESTMRKYIIDQNQSPEYLIKKSLLLMKHTNVTKIELKNLEDLCVTRQIILTNCNRLSCTLLSSDHKYVAAGSTDSLIYVWERSNLSYLNVLKNIENKTHTIPQNKDLVELLDKREASILRGHGGSVFDLAEISTAKILLSASHDKTFRVWDLRTKSCLEVFNEHEHRTWCIAACPFTFQVLTGSCEGTSCLWLLKYKRPLRFFVGHVDDVLVVKFHPNKIHIATGSSDKTIRLFEVSTGECIRLLTGHTDYVTCLEFHPALPIYLASASGNGEIMLWHIGKSSIMWKLKVDNMLVSDLAWFTDKIILASLTSGIILKCDTREDYMESSKNVNGYTTKFDRLMALKIFDSIVYTIGVPSKTSVQINTGVKSQAKVVKQVGNDIHQEQRSPSRSPISSSPSKLFFPQPAVENNSNSIIRPLHRSNSAIINNHTIDYLKMDLKSQHISLSSDAQSNNIRLIHSPSMTSLNLLKNDLLSTHQNDVQITNRKTSQINIQPKTAQPLKQNVHPASFNIPQQTNVSLQTQITNVQQKQSNNNLTIGTNLQHFQLQNNIHTASKNVQQQQVSQLQSVIQPRLTTTQLLQKNGLQQEQLLQLQQSVGSNFQLANTNINRQPVFKQIRPNTVLTKVNVKQRKSQQQTSIQLANKSVSQSFSEKTPTSQILAIRQQKSKAIQSSSLNNTEEDARLRQVVMASLLENNPEIFSRGQTVIGEITRSQSNSQLFNPNASDSPTKPQQNENL